MAKKKAGPSPMWMRKLRKRMPFIIGIGVFVTLYVGGLFAQLSHLVDDGFQFSFGVIHSILANFTCGFQGVAIVAIAYFGGGWYLVLRYRDKTRRELEADDRGFEIEGSGTYGTASLMGMEQAREYVEVESLSKTTGFIIGKFITDDDKTGLDKVVSVPPDGKRFSYSATGKPIMETDKNGERKQKREKLPFNGNRHVMVIGPSGSGKSFSYSLPNIFQSILQGESVVVTDPKGELYATTSRFAEGHGYVVKILNLAWLNGSDAVDFLGEVQGDQIGIEAQSFANIVISNTENPNGGGDAAYTNGEKNLLTALVLFIITAPQHLQQNKTVEDTLQKYLNERLNAEVDFTISHVATDDDPHGSIMVAGDRLDAMYRQRVYHWFGTNRTTGEFQLQPGSKVEARIIMTAMKGIRVEVFGVETFIRSRDLDYTFIQDARTEFEVGKRVWVVLTDIQRDKENDYAVEFQASVRDAKPDPREKGMGVYLEGSVFVGEINYTQYPTPDRPNVRPAVFVKLPHEGIQVSCPFPSGPVPPTTGAKCYVTITNRDLRKNKLYGRINHIVPTN